MKKAGRPKGSKSKTSGPRKAHHRFTDLLGPVKTNTPEGRKLYFRQLMRLRKGISPQNFRIAPPEDRKLVLDLGLLRPGAEREIMELIKKMQRKVK